MKHVRWLLFIFIVIPSGWIGFIYGAISLGVRFGYDEYINGEKLWKKKR